MRGPILAGRSILIVEDEPLIALDMEIALRRVGAKVLSTAYLWVGLHLQSIRAFRRPMLDLRLGLDDCTAICRRLSELRVPFMFYSGYGALLRMSVGRMLRSSSKPANAERDRRGRGRHAPESMVRAVLWSDVD